MTQIDWLVMLGTLFFIVIYGAWKTRKNKDIEDYLLGNKKDKWWMIGLSVMATQASAITFLSTPGQAYDAGMGFVQFYFGLPLAMIIIAMVFIPIYYKLKVYTAYEFLESRFDLKMRVLTAFLFLIQRGLAAGITIYAPAIILSQILDWSLSFTIIFIGVLVIIYTVSGGTKAVSQTHRLQMAVIFTGMFIAFGILVYYISRYVNFSESLLIAGKLGKMNVINLEVDPKNRYTLWTGIIGGLFLQLSYFGTDQSQVQRYLSGSSVRESRLGLMFNGLVKIPMQFFILLTGVLVFVFFQFYQPPAYFNKAALDSVKNEAYQDSIAMANKTHDKLWAEKKAVIQHYLADGSENATLENKMKVLSRKQKATGQKINAFISKANPSYKLEEGDQDYVFISWIMKYLPVGLVGLLLAVIFSAAMSSTSAELNALASTTTVDIYQRNIARKASSKHYVTASKIFTAAFGFLAILFASLASLFENLIEAVNILGSLFYGTILGIFLVAFFLKNVKSNPVFIATIISEIIVISLFYFSDIGYLWFNLIGCAGVFIISWILSQVRR